MEEYNKQQITEARTENANAQEAQGQVFEDAMRSGLGHASGEHYKVGQRTAGAAMYDIAS
mgnify:CR=1 FL=1